MIQKLILQANKLQAELIVSDIEHSGKAYLRAFTRLDSQGLTELPERPERPERPDLPELPEEQVIADDTLTLLTDARRLTLALGGKLLLAGFGSDDLLPMPTPEAPPAGFTYYTGFVHLYGSTKTLHCLKSENREVPRFRRTPLTAERVAEFLRLHQEGMRGVPNVPTLSERDVLDQLENGNLFLIELTDGTAVGLYDLAINPEKRTADLDEIALLPQWRSKGIGRCIISELSAELDAGGIETLSVLVATVNENALRLYRMIGFGQEKLYSNWFRQAINRRETIGPIHTATELVADLSRLGIQPGQTLLVHSSLKSVGWIPGGAVALIAALREAVGPEGTLVMPAQSGDNSDPAHWSAPPVPKEYWPIIRESMPAYDPKISPTRAIGKVAELFRTYPDALRSAHPSSSFAAQGPLALAIVGEHPVAFALGERSPNQKMVDLDASILQIGVDFDTCTLMHLAEYKTDCRLRNTQGASVLIDGKRVWQVYEDISMNSDEFIEPGRLLEQKGLVRTGRVGEAACRLFRAADAIDVACAWMKDNRMQRLTETDRPWLKDYLLQEPEYNLFLIGDLENFGFSAPFQDLMAYRKPESPDQVDSVLLRYNNHFIVYSDHDDFAIGPLLSALDYPDLDVLSGKKTIIDQLRPHLSDYHFRETFLMKRPVSGNTQISEGNSGNQLKKAQSDSTLRIADATVVDAPELAAFFDTIEEFRRNNTTLEKRTAELALSLASIGSHYVLIRKNGKIVACAGTTAENSVSAMVVGVATAPEYRGLGYATLLVQRLCEMHESAGRAYLCLFYDNPSAGAIYRGLGFLDAGIWMMGTPPARI